MYTTYKGVGNGIKSEGNGNIGVIPLQGRCSKPTSDRVICQGRVLLAGAVENSEDGVFTVSFFSTILPHRHAVSDKACRPKSRYIRRYATIVAITGTKNSPTMLWSSLDTPRFLWSVYLCNLAQFVVSARYDSRACHS